jgi:hypothetical protein
MISSIVNTMGVLTKLSSAPLIIRRCLDGAMSHQPWSVALKMQAAGCHDAKTGIAAAHQSWTYTNGATSVSFAPLQSLFGIVTPAACILSATTKAGGHRPVPAPPDDQWRRRRWSRRPCVYDERDHALAVGEAGWSLLIECGGQNPSWNGATTLPRTTHHANKKKNREKDKRGREGGERNTTHYSVAAEFYVVPTEAPF